MVRKVSRGIPANPYLAAEKAQQSHLVGVDAKAVRFLYSTFYLRLLLFAMLLPVALFVALEAALSIIQPGRRLVLIQPFLLGAYCYVIAVPVLRFIAMLCYALIPPLGALPMAMFDWLILPFLGFVRDLFIDTPRVFCARVVEMTVGPRNDARVSILAIGLPFILFAIVFTCSFLGFRSYYLEWVRLP